MADSLGALGRNMEAFGTIKLRVDRSLRIKATKVDGRNEMHQTLNSLVKKAENLKRQKNL